MRSRRLFRGGGGENSPQGVAMAQIVPIASLRGKERLTEAVKGDIYTSSWTSVQGTGKKKRVVEHTVHVNPGSVGLGAIGLAVGAGVAALGGMLALRFGGKELATKDHVVRRTVDEYQPVYEQVTVVDSPGYWTNVKYTQVWVPPVTHLENRITSAYRVIVMSNNFVPHGTYKDLTEALIKMQARHKNPHELSEVVAKQQWVKVAGKSVLRHFYEFKVDGIGIVDKEKDAAWWNPLGL